MAKAIFFDMDATTIGQETINELAASYKKSSEVKKITELAMQGKLDFEDALRKRVKVLENAPVSIINLTQPRLIIEPDLIDFVQYCKDRGIPCFLISGGFVELAEEIARKAGMADFHANQLQVKNERLTGELLGEIVDAEAKAIWMQKKCKDLNLSLKEVVAVGDGANDIPMMLKAGLSVGYKPKEILYNKVNAINLSGSHRFLKDFLFA
ncbi:MAG: phosphoserine phosphatase SerB [Bdellovibrionota bacterium]